MLRPLLAAAAVAVAAFPGANAAHAACAGTQQLGEVCVTVDWSALPSVALFGDRIEECVLVNGQCVYTVVVPIPSVTPGSSNDPIDVYCRGQGIRCSIL